MDPAIEDIRRVTMINGVVQPITLEDGTVLDGKNPYVLEAMPVPVPQDNDANVILNSLLN